MKEVQSEYRHYRDVRCEFHKDGVTVRIGLSWDTIDCPECRKLKRPSEPETQSIDTRGD